MYLKQTARVWVSALLFVRCSCYHGLHLHLSGPQVPQIENGNTNNTNITVMLWRVNKITFMKHYTLYVCIYLFFHFNIKHIDHNIPYSWKIQHSPISLIPKLLPLSIMTHHEQSWAYPSDPDFMCVCYLRCSSFYLENLYPPGLSTLCQNSTHSSNLSLNVISQGVWPVDFFRAQLQNHHTTQLIVL